MFIVLAAAALPVLFAPSARAMDCRLAPDGTITTWLVAPPVASDPKEDFAKLPDWAADAVPAEAVTGAGGASKASGDVPVPVPVPEPAKQAGKGVTVPRFQARAWNTKFVDLSDRTLPRGDSVFYLACELRADKSGPHTLHVLYWSQIAVWLDGKPVVTGGADRGSNLLVPRETVEIRLDAGKTHRLLVKLRSRGRQAFMKIALTTGPEKEAKPAAVTCVLRAPESRAAELLVQSLSIKGQNGSIVQAGRGAPVQIESVAGCPIVKGEVRVKAAILDHAGKPVQQLAETGIDADKLPGGSIPLGWTVPEATNVPRYSLRADVLVGVVKAGELTSDFHVIEGLANWLRDLGKRVSDSAGRLGAKQYDSPDFALTRLKLEKTILLAQRQGDEGPPMAWIDSELQGCEEAVTRVEKTEKPPAVSGLAELAYLSDVDDSPQPYYVYVPREKPREGSKAETALRPCVVYLHGYSPSLDKLGWFGLPQNVYDYCDRYGYILVAPFARSNTDFQGIGEADVMKVLDLAASRFPIDRDRVFLFGYSMGGMGAYTLAAHYPGSWRGLIVLSGRADYYLWKQYDRAKVEPYKRILADTEFAAAMPGNLRNVPALIYHGGADTVVEVEQSRRMAAKLKELGADVTYRELPGRDHWILDEVMQDDAVFRWMHAIKNRPVVRWPDNVDLTTFTLKCNKAYWVTVLDMVRWGEAAWVRAKRVPDANVMEVKTENVARLQLDLMPGWFGQNKVLVVRINGKEHQVEKTGLADFEVEPIVPDGAADAGKMPATPTGKMPVPRTLRKTAALCGPVKEAYNSRFLVVTGGPIEQGPDGERIDLDRERAVAEWEAFTRSGPRVKRDAQVTKEDVQDSNLILYGTPSTNAKLKEIADKLPIRVTDEGFEFEGKKYSNKEYGLVMVYPNPQNPARLVVVRSGLPYGGGLSVNHKLDLLPDFVIFEKGQDYDGSDRAVVAGFFDENWQPADRLTWHRGEKDPDPRLPEAKDPRKE